MDTFVNYALLVLAIACFLFAGVAVVYFFVGVSNPEQTTWIVAITFVGGIVALALRSLVVNSAKKISQ